MSERNKIAILSGLYLLIGLSVALTQPQIGQAPWFTTTAVGVALILVCGRRCWPIIVICELAIGWARYRTFGPGLADATATMVEIALLVMILRSWRFDPALDSSDDVIKLGAAAAIAGAVSAVIALGLLRIVGFEHGTSIEMIKIWFLVEMTDLVVMLPILLLLMMSPFGLAHPFSGLKRRAVVELVVVTTVGAALVLWTFATTRPNPDNTFDIAQISPTLLCLLPLLWVALRFGRLRTAMFALTIDLIAINSFRYIGHHLFLIDEQEVTFLQIFMFVVSFAGILIAVSVDSARSSRDTAKAILDASPAAILVLDSDRRARVWNRAAETIFGWSADEVIGRIPPMIPTEMVGEFMRRGPEQLAAPTQSTRDYESRGGAVVAAKLNTNPLFDSDGVAIGIVAILEDLSEERRLEGALAGEQADRTEVRDALAAVRRGDRPEQTADALCRAALEVHGIDGAALLRPLPNGGLSFIGAAFPPGLEIATRLVDRASGASVAELFGAGPWTMSWTRELWGAGPMGDALEATSITAVGGAEVEWEDQTIAYLICGTMDVNGTAQLDARMSAVKEIATFAAALLGPQLVDDGNLRSLQTDIASVIEDREFRSVFQPVVELSTGAIVGYEALTRFTTGIRPDLVFADAAAAGLGIELERQCIRSSLKSFRGAEPGTSLSINVSPAFISTGELPNLLSGLDHPIVLEVTEHEQISDYEALVDIIRGIDGVKISVDDAGAGYAGLRHILELRPDIVKLDIWLIRGIADDPARQAMVAGMRYFAEATGARLLAEGIETAEDAEAVARLGVELGQGFYFGAPESLST